jgi:hypothetical protein
VDQLIKKLKQESHMYFQNPWVISDLAELKVPSVDTLDPESLKENFLFDFSGKFENVLSRKRVLDSYVLTKDRMKYDRIKDEFMHLFLDYKTFLQEPLQDQILSAKKGETVVIPDGEESFLKMIIKKKTLLASQGFEYRAKENIDWENEEAKVVIKEVMHVKGLQIQRSLNPPPLEVVITMNDYDNGYLEYNFNDIRFSE